jgi:hypothetical protein
MSEMEFHPLANLFPMLDVSQAAELVADIEAHGLRQAIVTFEGKILDGRNRLAACKLTGVEPRFKEFTGNDPLSYVISLNLNRRHLSESQRATIAAKIATLEHGQRQSGKFAGVPAQAEAAKRMNVSERSVRSARQVLEKGTPELIASVEQGKTSINAAIKSIKPKQDSPDLARAIEAIEQFSHLPANETYVRPADKYFAKQEATLGKIETPVRAANEAMRDDLKGAIASIRSIGNRLAEYKFRDVDAALTNTENAIRGHMPGAVA